MFSRSPPLKTTVISQGCIPPSTHLAVIVLFCFALFLPLVVLTKILRRRYVLLMFFVFDDCRAILYLAFKCIFTPMTFLNCFVHKGLAALLLCPNLPCAMLFQMLKGDLSSLLFRVVQSCIHLTGAQLYIICFSSIWCLIH